MVRSCCSVTVRAFSPIPRPCRCWHCCGVLVRTRALFLWKIRHFVEAWDGLGWKGPQVTQFQSRAIDQAAQGLIQRCLEQLQGWGIQTSLANLFQCLSTE